MKVSGPQQHCQELEWLVFSVNLARPQYPDVGSNTSLSVAVKVFVRCA